jgi:hypothetical protein
VVSGAPDRRATLAAALGFLALEPRSPDLQLLHRSADSWRGVGDVVVGMERQGYRLHLTNIEAGTWRATFSHDSMTAAEGFAAAPTPWKAVPSSNYPSRQDDPRGRATSSCARRLHTQARRSSRQLACEGFMHKRSDSIS